MRAVTALQEAESFPAVQNSGDCLWALGVSSGFGVPGLFSAVFIFLLWIELPLAKFKTAASRDTARGTSLQRVHCHRRI